jgi:hypothetical protein
MPPQDPQNPQGGIPIGDAGIGGVSPGGMTPYGYNPYGAGISAPDIMNQLNTVFRGMSGSVPQGAGSTVPFVSQSRIDPRMPIPPMMSPTNRDQNVRPNSTSLHDQRMAHQQSIGNTLGNIAGMALNQIAEEKHQKDSKTIADAASYSQAAKNAEVLKQMFPDNPAAQKYADGIIKQNTDSLRAMMKDEKTAKMVGKALSWDFTDPEKMNSPEVKTGQAGVKMFQDQQKAGIGAPTSQDKKIEDILNQAGGAAKNVGAIGQGLPSAISTVPGGQQPSPIEANKQLQGMGQPSMAPGSMGGQPPNMGQPASPAVRPQDRVEQYLASRPTEMQINPAYMAQQQYEQQLFRDILTKLGPSMTREMGADYRANANNASREYKARLDAITKLDLKDKDAENRLRVQESRNAGNIAVAQTRAQVYGQGVNNPRTAQASGMGAFQQFKTVSGAIDKAFGDNSHLESDIAKMETDRTLAKTAGENARAEYIEQQIREKKAQIDSNTNYIEKMSGIRDSLTDSMTKGGIVPDDKGGFKYDPSLMAIATGGAAPAAAGATPSSVAGMGGTSGAPFGSTGAIAPAIGSNPRQMEQWYSTIENAAKQYGVDANLVASIVQIESNGNPGAISKTGATGLGQFTERTGKAYGMPTPADRRNPVKNIEGISHYMSDLIKKNHGDIAKSIGDYYGWKHGEGEPTVEQHIEKVLNEYKRRGGSFDVASAPPPASARYLAQSGQSIEPPKQAAAAPSSSPQYTGGIRVGPYLIGGKKVDQASAAPQQAASGAEKPSAAKPSPTKPGEDDSSEEDYISGKKSSSGEETIDVFQE